MNADSSLDRNSTAFAMSWISPSLPRGVLAMIGSSTFSGTVAIMDVRVKPGETEFTRTFAKGMLDEKPEGPRLED